MKKIRTVRMPDKLQWGRSLSTAEMRGVGLADGGQTAASMGPQSFNCGNLTIGTGLISAALLQWGRSLSTAEIFLDGSVSIPTTSFNGAAVFQLRK